MNSYQGKACPCAPLNWHDCLKRHCRTRTNSSPPVWPVDTPMLEALILWTGVEGRGDVSDVGGVHSRSDF